MKRILILTATTILAHTVNAAPAQAYIENDSHAAFAQHATHHSNAKQLRDHQQKHLAAVTAAHLHDHNDDAKKAAQHIAEHHGSVALAHGHDHRNTLEDAAAHSHHHERS